MSFPIMRCAAPECADAPTLLPRLNSAPRANYCPQASAACSLGLTAREVTGSTQGREWQKLCVGARTGKSKRWKGKKGKTNVQARSTGGRRSSACGPAELSTLRLGGLPGRCPQARAGLPPGCHVRRGASRLAQPVEPRLEVVVQPRPFAACRAAAHAATCNTCTARASIWGKGTSHAVQLAGRTAPQRSPCGPHPCRRRPPPAAPPWAALLPPRAPPAPPSARAR